MRLLLVEPHSVLARALKIGLDEEGFAVEVAGDMERAEARLRENRYDVILLDLAAGTGLPTFRRWRRCGLRTPVLVLTVLASEMDQRESLHVVGFDIVVKPLALEELLARLRRLVQEGSACGEEPDSVVMGLHNIV